MFDTSIFTAKLFFSSPPIEVMDSPKKSLIKRKSASHAYRMAIIGDWL